MAQYTTRYSLNPANMDAWAIRLREILGSLLSNDLETFQAIRVHLLRLCQDILETGTTDPVITDQEYLEMVANTAGALDCLHFIGYLEMLPVPSSGSELVGLRKPLYFTRCLDNNQVRFFLKSLRCLRHSTDLLWSVRPTYPGLSSVAYHAPEAFPGPTMSPAYYQERESLRQSLKALVRHTLSYEEPSLVEKAKDMLPWENMVMESKVKATQAERRDPLAYWDHLMVELTRWFKFEFFKWCNEPACPQCGSKTTSAKGMVAPTPEDIRYGANRVEAYVCNSCKAAVRFPRYNSVEKLIETRVGRCGEWANCFTFFCRVLGFEARYVIDWYGDHVWTEYYSPSQKRWIHVDSCENIVDNPLMYERGWSKKMMFVFGIARDHVVDVTMRYTCDRKAVMTRRATKFLPGWLYDMLHALNHDLQSNLPERKRDEVSLLLVHDFLNMMYEQRVTPESLQGRSSGSSSWVEARGEGGRNGAAYVFRPTNTEMEAGVMHIRYNCRLDAYERLVDGKSLRGWHNCTHICRGIFRKEEYDWKMAYLARLEGVREGVISWKFELKDDFDCMYPIDTVFVRFEKATYEDGAVKAVLSSRRTCVPLQVSNIETSAMVEYPTIKGSCSFSVHSVLTGGRGNHAWQHAQLFRQTTMPEEDSLFPEQLAVWPFEVIVKFRPRPKGELPPSLPPRSHRRSGEDE